ncbi:MAG: trigger factor [Parvibaculaceae bacterium]|jgi:trigger factor|nr:trigger factor [Parvibaculaceae bacterium]
MQVTEISAEGLKRELSVTVAAQDLETRLAAKLDEMKDQVRLKGFRPGKVPVAHLRNTYGKQVMTEIIQEMIGESSQKALQDKDLRPAMQPAIDFEGGLDGVVEGKDDLVYNMKFEIIPEITLADFSTLKLERPVAEVDDAEVEESIERLASQQKSFETKEGKAEDGDLVVIDFVGTVDDVAFEGGTAEGASLEIGSGQFIPGFEEQLIGASAGDDVSVNVTFPADYGSEELAGKDAVFAVKVNEVKAAGEAVIDDEFAQKFGMEDLSKLKDAVRDQIGSDYNNFSRARMKRAMLDELDGLHSFELPPTLVEQEFGQIWQQFEQELQEQGKTIADADESEEKLREDYKVIAERRVRLGLVLAEVGEKNQIQVSDMELNQAIAERARQFPGQEKQVYEYFTKDAQAMAQVRAPLFEEKVVDFIAELATVTDVTISKDELMKDPDAPEEEAAADKPKAKKAAAKKTATKKTAAKKTATKKTAAKKTATKKTAAKKTAAKKKTATKKDAD